MMKTINTINGIPLHYARLTNHPYGTRGLQRNFDIDEKFLNTLKNALDEVFAHCPFGKPDVITTGGIYVEKPGEHGLGKAFDLDAIFWKDTTLVTKNFIHQKELYLAIESFLRKHFGIVLNYYYSNHEDHWHVDTSVIVDYNENSTSETLYLQMVLKHIYGKHILIDGIWGTQTKGFINDVLERLNINTPITTKKNYLKFLDLTGKIAFKLSEEKVTPLYLLDNLTEVIDSLPLANRIPIQEALNSFIAHTETSTWLHNLVPSNNIETIIDSII